jgi:hypothetical protein
MILEVIRVLEAHNVMVSDSLLNKDLLLIIFQVKGRDQYLEILLDETQYALFVKLTKKETNSEDNLPIKFVMKDGVLSGLKTMNNEEFPHSQLFLRPYKSRK